MVELTDFVWFEPSHPESVNHQKTLHTSEEVCQVSSEEVSQASSEEVYQASSENYGSSVHTRTIILCNHA